MAYQTQQAQAQFDAWSDSYDQSWLQAAFFRPSHELLFRHLHLRTGRLLDIGCGTGLFLAEVLVRCPGVEVVGLDLSEKMTAQAVRRLRTWPDRAAIVRGDSGRLPFRNDSFDAVTCSHSFHHYPDQERVVAEMHRVLRPGGRLLLIDGDRDRPLGWLIFEVYVPWKEGEVRHCSARQFRELFRQAGFVNVHQYRRRLPIPFLLTLGTAAKEDTTQTRTVGAA
ncbi:MAG: class I SAM-dependent methyltransferase [Gemmatales bacterium]|nr:class I SAM-dependent methyltransferase [Gemmatales bacterium]MDW8387096.1 class I SAM-dependent methyltransferase [Gemmatales bacterium]